MPATLKDHIRNFIPKPLILWRRKRIVTAAIRRNARYNTERFILHSGIASNEIVALWAKITFLEHVIEKALSLPEPRPGFGSGALGELLEKLPAYIAKAGYDKTAITTIAAIRCYLNFNVERGVTPPHHQEILQLLGSVQNSGGDVCASSKPTLTMSRDELMRKARISFEEFAFCRHSVRQFGADAVTDEVILHAVRIAQKSPSVCNRQGTRAHIYPQEDKKKAILQIQNGNRGFGHLASHVIIITFDLRCLITSGERNQAWADGGLFAMSFMYAVHSLGLGACPLHWCMTPEEDLALRSVAEIPPSEEVIMLIVVGSLPPTLTVAASSRKELKEVACVHRTL